MNEKTIYFRASDICRASSSEITSIENRIPLFRSKKCKTYALNHTNSSFLISHLIFLPSVGVCAPRILWEMRKEKSTPEKYVRNIRARAYDNFYRALRISFAHVGKWLYIYQSLEIGLGRKERGGEPLLIATWDDGAAPVTVRTLLTRASFSRLRT